MTIDSIPLLMTFFWVGFSLSYVTLSWIARIKPQFGAKDFADHQPLVPVAFSVRLLLTVIGLSGALGAAGFVGQLRGPGTDVTFLLGLIGGALIAYFLHLRKAP
jgi:hypothetical protein